MEEKKPKIDGIFDVERFFKRMAQGLTRQFGKEWGVTIDVTVTKEDD